MKRDMDLVRFILIQVEHADGRIDAENLGNEDTALDVVFYHLELMQAHGLLDASLQYGYDGSKNVAYRGSVSGLTWDGHDYLDAIRDDRVWKRTKKTIAESVGSVTFASIKSVASMIAEQLIKAHLGIL